MESIEIRYEGPGVDIEGFGVTCAYFLVQPAGGVGKETAVHLSDGAARFLARALGRELTKAFRDEMAKEGGERLIRRYVAERGHADAIVALSQAALEDHPEILTELKQLVAA